MEGQGMRSLKKLCQSFRGGLLCWVTKGEELNSPSSHGGRGGSVLAGKGHVTLLSGLKVAVSSSQVLLAFGHTMGTPEWEPTVSPLPAD